MFSPASVLPPSSRASIVTVVIVARNAAAWLRDAIGSVLSQTDDRWECIVVDDGSTDATAAIADAMRARDARGRIRVIRQSHAGEAGARNAGIAAATSEYVVPLDAADVLHPEFIAKTLAALDENPSADVAYTDAHYFGDDIGLAEAGEFTRAALQSENQLHYASLYRRRVWDAVGGYNAGDTARSDWDFWIDATQAGIRGVHVANPLLLFRSHGNRLGSATPTDSPVDMTNTLADLVQRGLAQSGVPVRLHLGCGETLLPGYTNIDYPATEHTVMECRPDFEGDITTMRFPMGTVSEIRLHHVFEHFTRVQALVRLITWHEWLGLDGTLRIETPDIEGSARMIASDASFDLKMAAIRHLAGDQAAAWAFHLDHWFPERYQRTLTLLGFAIERIDSNRWPHSPHLCNVEVVARKRQHRTRRELRDAAVELLRDSMVAAVEAPTHAVWVRDLDAALEKLPVLSRVE